MWDLFYNVFKSIPCRGQRGDYNYDALGGNITFHKFMAALGVGIMVGQCCPLKLTNQLLYLGIYAYPRHMKYIVEYASNLVK